MGSKRIRTFAAALATGIAAAAAIILCTKFCKHLSVPLSLMAGACVTAIPGLRRRFYSRDGLFATLAIALVFSALSVVTILKGSNGERFTIGPVSLSGYVLIPAVFFGMIGVMIKGLHALLGSEFLLPSSREPGRALSGRSASLVVGLVVFLSLIGFWVFLGFFPHGTSADTLSQWNQVHGLEEFNDIHTPAHTMFLWGLLSVIDSYTFVVAVHICMLSFLGGLFGGYLHRKGVGVLPMAVLFGAFAVLPQVRCFTFPWKDTPYTFCVGIATYLLMRTLDDDYVPGVKNGLIAGVTLAFCFLFRYNGIVCLLLAGAYLIVFCAKRRAFQQLAAFLLALLFSVASVNWVAYSVLDCKRAPNGYSMQVFGSGIAAVVANGGDITEEERAELDDLLGIEWMREQYAPWNKKSLIWYAPAQPFIDGLAEHKREVVVLYLKLLPRNFLICARDVLENTYAIWGYEEVHSHIAIAAFVLLAVGRSMNRRSLRRRWIVLIPVAANIVSVAISTVTNETRYLFPTYALAAPLILYFAAHRGERGEKKGTSAGRADVV